VVRDADTGEVLREVAASIGRATNNVAEYQGLLAGLRAAGELDPEAVEVRMDSKLVVEQMSGRWQVKHPDMRALAREAFDVVRRLPHVSFVHVPRERNKDADRLANEAMDAAARGEEWVPRRPERAEVPTPERGDRLPGWTEATAPPTVTVLLRHGSTPLTAEKRFSGLGDADLSPVGVAQVEAAADRVAAEPAVAAVVSSPLRRTRRTAAVVAARLGREVRVEDGLRETDFGDWEGHTLAEVREKWPEELQAWWSSTEVAPPGGESFAAVGRRVRQARDRLLASYAGQRIVVVTHVTPIKTLVRLALDAPASVLWRTHVDPCGLTEVDWHADGTAVLRRFNDTAHLRS
jgi:probable phosphoglycerate mutase